MKTKANKMDHRATWIICAAVAALGAGCGDGFFHKPGGMFDAVLSRQIRARMAEADVELLEYTGCQIVRSDDPDARCEGVSDTQIEVFVDGQSLIFDFSNVAKDGRISETDFEGYVLVANEGSRMPRILQAIVDAAESSIAAEQVDLQFDDESVVVNFQGIDYDDATFVKVDLVLDEPS
ncbi:MAG: hypothetical protein PVH21_10750 [Myxococcales bacterium]|jgi:hypothetical protein